MSTPSTDLAPRIAAYSALGAVFALGAASTAQGAIVYSVVNDTFGPGGDIAGIDLGGLAGNEYEIRWDGSRSVYLTNRIGPVQNKFFHYEDNVAANAGGKADANALAAGFLLGPGGGWSNENSETLASLGGDGNFSDYVGLVRYLGLKFDLGAGDRFGWAAIIMNADLKSGTLVSYAYDDSGAAIRTGDTGTVVSVPEPGAASLALLAAGAAGLASLRRRRRD